MLHKTRARNARPYGYGVIMRSSFFRNIVGARIARPLLEFVQNFGFAHLLYVGKLRNPRRERGDSLDCRQKAILPPEEGE